MIIPNAAYMWPMWLPHPRPTHRPCSLRRLPAQHPGPAVGARRLPLPVCRHLGQLRALHGQPSGERQARRLWGLAALGSAAWLRRRDAGARLPLAAPHRACMEHGVLESQAARVLAWAPTARPRYRGPTATAPTPPSCVLLSVVPGAVPSTLCLPTLRLRRSSSAPKRATPASTHTAAPAGLSLPPEPAQ